MHIIAGKYYKQRVVSPKGNGTRPTSSRMRETLFNILQDEIEGVNILDIFAGSGAIGLEALSRGALFATFIESDREAFSTLKQNIGYLKAEKEALPLFGDYIKQIQHLGKRKAQFQIIFADAPYHMKEVTEILIGETVKEGLLAPYGKLFIESSVPLSDSIELHGLVHKNSRKSGKTYLHQFVRSA